MEQLLSLDNEKEFIKIPEIKNGMNKYGINAKMMYRVFHTLRDQYKNRNKHVLCDHFYLETNDTLYEARGYGTPLFLFKPTRDRLQFHIKNLIPNLEWFYPPDNDSWSDGGFDFDYDIDQWRKNSNIYKKRQADIIRKCACVGKILENSGFNIVYMSINIHCKGYIDSCHDIESNIITQFCETCNEDDYLDIYDWHDLEHLLIYVYL